MLLVLNGCATTSVGGRAVAAPSSGAYSLRQCEADPDTTFQLAEGALAARGFTIDVRDVGGRALRTMPMRVEPDSASRLASRRPRRMVGHVFVDTSETTTRLFCRVVVEERVTEAYRLQATDQQSSDLPTSTPIERDAGTTREQQQVWRTVRRDRRMERDVLESVLQELDARRGAGSTTPTTQTGGA